MGLPRVDTFTTEPHPAARLLGSSGQLGSPPRDRRCHCKARILQRWNRWGRGRETSFSRLQSSLSLRKRCVTSTVEPPDGGSHNLRNTWITPCCRQAQPPGCISYLLKVARIRAEC